MIGRKFVGRLASFANFVVKGRWRLSEIEYDALFENTLEARRAWDTCIDAMQASFDATDPGALAGRLSC